MNRYLVILLLCFLSFFSLGISADDDDDGDASETVQIIDGQVVIQLEEEIQQLSGLETQAFKSTELQTEFIAYGSAVSLDPLISILNQYLSLSAKQAAAKARLALTEKGMTRLRNLHKNAVVSIQKLQRQQSKWQSDKALYDEMVYKSKLIVNSSQLQWGEKITQWATGRHSEEFEKLLSGKSTLLTITTPAASPRLQNIESIYISPTGNREKAFKASFVSVLPSIDTFSQGLQYSFFSDNPKIKPGMNVTAWIPEQENTIKGLIIPKSALTWHLGQSFVFIKIDDEHFVHRTIENPISVPNGYFISEQLADGEEIVVKGTQMLLSHEFRSQIPDEDDD